MKKLLLLLLLCTSYAAFAQPRFDGEIRHIEDRSPSWIGIDATCHVSVYVDSTTAGPNFRHQLNSIKVHSLKIKGVTYSASQIPANVLNAIEEDARVQVSFNLYDGDVNVKKLDGTSHISWDQLLRLPASEHYKQATTDAGVKLYESGRLSIRNVKITSLSYGSKTLTDFVDEKSNPAKAPVKSTSKVADNSVTEVGLTMPGSSATGASAETSGEGAAEDTATPVNTSGNDPLANYTPSAAYSGATTEKEVYVQAAATVVGGLLDEMNANAERKQARFEAEYKEKISREYDEKRKKEKTKFLTEFMPLVKRAENGDVNARMILYFAAEALRCDEFVPKKDQWFKEALANNNADARSGNKSTTYIQDLEETAIATNNVDAMVRLGVWYSSKENYEGLVGGGNEQKALEWFNRAAAAGSPNAAYFLGMIYTYGQFIPDKYEQKLKIKFTVAKDEKVALDWFIKADQPNYRESIYARSQSNTPFLASSSFYVPDTRYQLYLLYKKGKIVGDKAKAEALKDEAKLLKDGYPTTKTESDYDKLNEKFSDISRYK